MAIMSFNLKLKSVEYLERVPKGDRSKVVNRAIEFYSANKVQDLLDNIEALQQVITKQRLKLAEFGGCDCQNARPGWGKRVRNSIRRLVPFL